MKKIFYAVAVIPVIMMLVLFAAIATDNNILGAAFGVLGIVLFGLIVFIEGKR